MNINLNLSHPKIVKSFLKRLRENFVSVDLIRVGGNADGGYLVPNILHEIQYCFSPGVNNVVDFELQLSNDYNIKSFMADASIKTLEVNDPNFDFIPKFLGSRTKGGFITLSDWISDSLDDISSSAILQMDIEGAEYDVLTYESSKSLSRFSAMIIEFHFMQNIAVINSLISISSIFEKIFENFSICHMHPNNYGYIEKYNDIEIPITVEISFIRNDFIEKIKNNNSIELPNALDIKNCPSRPDILMPKIWWDKDITD